ncbi:hypothetical protein [Maliponia aquimaris]|nr:hypothetical protein [Maliponia aquimaris]
MPPVYLPRCGMNKGGSRGFDRDLARVTALDRAGRALRDDAART